MDASLSSDIAKVAVALAPAFACGFAVQQALQIIDPLVSMQKDVSKADGANIKRSVMGLISLFLGIIIAYLGKVQVIEPLSKITETASFSLPGWLAVGVNGLIISAGTEGFNSIMKFLSYQKEAAKSDAAVKKVNAMEKQVPNKKGALALVNG
jgi:hypothetical protein